MAAILPDGMFSLASLTVFLIFRFLLFSHTHKNVKNSDCKHKSEFVWPYHRNTFGYETESELSEYHSLSTLQIRLKNRKMYICIHG